VNAQISRYSCFIHSAKEPVKVTKAEKDLLRLLKNNSVRIVKNSKTIDVEISNKTLGTVDFGELINYKVTDLVDPLTYVVGKDMTNVYGSLTKANGIIISGGSASGKQATIRSIIDSILYRNSRDDIEIDFLNLKYSDFEIYNKAPQVIMVADTPELVIKTLDNLIERMDICFDLLSKTKMKNIEEFNDSAYGDRKMRHTIIVIDELAKLLEIDRKIEDKLIRILQVGRAAGYHLIICTGENDSISVKLNANCMDKIILKDGLDKEADKLIGLGDAFYDSASGKEHVRRRVQIAFHSQGDTQKICEYLEANSK
jgi:S-DNA-T family DNA segregation ATPase FtsK/SpoIIIE